jgi:hypothetical protein
MAEVGQALDHSFDLGLGEWASELDGGFPGEFPGAAERAAQERWEGADLGVASVAGEVVGSEPVLAVFEEVGVVAEINALVAWFDQNNRVALFEAKIEAMGFFGLEAAGRGHDADTGVGGGVQFHLRGSGVGEDDDFGIAEDVVSPPTGDLVPGVFIRNGDSAEVDLGMS